MTDIDPKSIPILDDVIEDNSHDEHTNDQHAPVAGEASAVEADDLFSPASFLDEEVSLPEDNIDHAANIAALEGGMQDSRLAADQGQEISAVGDTDSDNHPASDATDHIDAITALDESTPVNDDHPAPGNEPGKNVAATVDDVIDDTPDDFVDEVSADPELPAGAGSAPTGAVAEPVNDAVAETEQTGSSQQPEINTAALTNQIIDRLMPEIEQRLRVIIDLTLRENLRDRNPEE